MHAFQTLAMSMQDLIALLHLPDDLLEAYTPHARWVTV